MASSGSNIGFALAKFNDPAWAHCIKVSGKRNQTICLYCNKHIQGGGITRLKQHLADVGHCSKVPSDVQWQMKQLLDDLKKEQAKKNEIFEMQLEILMVTMFQVMKMKILM